MKNTLQKSTSIRLNDKNSLKIDHYLLDCFSFSKYGTPYEDSKKEVNSTIRELCKAHNLETVRGVKYYLTLSMLSPAQMESVLALYENKSS